MTYRIAVFAALRQPEAGLPRCDVPRRQQQVTVPRARAASTACGGVPQEVCRGKLAKTSGAGWR
jgi:hypothetical protein